MHHVNNVSYKFHAWFNLYKLTIEKFCPSVEIKKTIILKLVNAEAVAPKCSLKKCRPATLLKGNSATGVFL